MIETNNEQKAELLKLFDELLIRIMEHAKLRDEFLDNKNKLGKSYRSILAYYARLCNGREIIEKEIGRKLTESENKYLNKINMSI